MYICKLATIWVMFGKTLFTIINNYLLIHIQQLKLFIDEPILSRNNYKVLNEHTKLRLVNTHLCLYNFEMYCMVCMHCVAKAYQSIRTQPVSNEIVFQYSSTIDKVCVLIYICIYVYICVCTTAKIEENKKNLISVELCRCRIVTYKNSNSRTAAYEM